MTAQLYNELQQIENKVKDCEKSLENLSKKKVIINAKCDTSFGEDVLYVLIQMIGILLTLFL